MAPTEAQIPVLIQAGSVRRSCKFLLDGGKPSLLATSDSLSQGMKTRTPKVVPLKVPLIILHIWPLYTLRDP